MRNTVPVTQAHSNYIANSLSFSRGYAVSGAFAYLGSKYQNQIGGKTGTAEVYGKKDTSWLATWGPTYKDGTGNTRARFVMVGMIEQAGTGATAAGPMLKRIWDGIFGVNGPPAVVPGRRPAATTLPTIAPQVQVTAQDDRSPPATRRAAVHASTPLALPLRPARPRLRRPARRHRPRPARSIGALLVWAATRDQQAAHGGNPQSFLYRHLFNIVIAAGLMLAASRLDARLLRLFGPIVYLASLARPAAGLRRRRRRSTARTRGSCCRGGVRDAAVGVLKLGLVVGMAVLFTQRAERARRRRAADDPGRPAAPSG